jgi:replicative DNA helicase
MVDALPYNEKISEKISQLVDARAEQSLLGTLLCSPNSIHKLPQVFNAEHFSYPDHQDLYKVMLSLSASGDLNMAAVSNALRGTNMDMKYVAGLMSAMVHPNTIESHARTITDLWRRREMVRISEAISVSAFQSGGDDMSRSAALFAMSELDAIAASASQTQTMFSITEAADAAIERAKLAAEGVVVGVTTGLRSLDEAMGPFEPGALYVIAGRPGMGKTALGLQSAIGLAGSGAKVFYDSLEMQAAQLGRRAIALEARVPQFRVKGGKWSDNEFQAIAAARSRFEKMSMIIDQQTGVNTAVIALKARAAKRKMGGLDAIFVDHMHIVQPDASAERNGAARGTEKVSNDLKRLAVDMQVPVIALAQLSRGVEGREDKRPAMSDLRQSGAIEQDAEAVLLLYRAEYYLPKNEPTQGPNQTLGAWSKAVEEWRDAKERLAGKAEVIIAKLRDGEPSTVNMRFDGARTAFEEEGF